MPGSRMASFLTSLNYPRKHYHCRQDFHASARNTVVSACGDDLLKLEDRLQVRIINR